MKLFNRGWMGSGREIVAYQYHLQGFSPIKTPHLHLGSVLGCEGVTNLHLPTGRIALEDILEFAIRELHAQPTPEDWAKLLQKTRDDYRANKTW